MKQKIFSLLAGCFGVCVSLVAQSGSTWYVKPQGGGDGQSWATALGDLHAALASAQAGDRIWVAAGTYLPDTAADRTRRFELKSGVRLLGGFSGTEQSANERNIDANPTILSGNIGDAADSTDNSQTIVYMAYPDSNTLLDGFILQHAYAFSDTVFDNFLPALSGGGVYVEASNGIALPVFRNCTFRHNYARSYGGAVFINGQNTLGDTPLFYNCVFENNKARRHGGAIYLTGGNPYDRGVEFDHCKFLGNLADLSQASQGGGIYWAKNIGETETIEFKSCVIKGNKGRALAGFFPLHPSIIGFVGISFDSCEISENSSTSPSSASVFYMYNLYDLPFTFNLTNCRMLKNSSGYASLFVILSDAAATINIHNNFFRGNRGTVGIAGIYDHISIYSNWVEDNYYGLGVYSFSLNDTFYFFDNVYKNVAPFGAAGRGPSYIFNNVFVNCNTVPDYDPMWSGNSPVIPISGYQSSTELDTIFVFNNLFYRDTFYNPYYGANNTGNPDGLSQQCVMNIQNNIVIKNFNVYDGSVSAPFPISYDSCFFDYNMMDFPCPTTDCGIHNTITNTISFLNPQAGDFRQPPCSPAVNAGNNSVIAPLTLYDLAGELRIQDDITDIGPYESPALQLALSPQITPACHGAATGKAEFEVQNGCPPYTYAWDNGTTAGTGNEGLSAGSYMFTISDSRSKTMVTDITIPGSDFDVFLTGDTLLCQGQSTSLAASVTGIAGGLQFSWSNGFSDSVQSGLFPGFYGLIVTDGVGCISSDSVQVTEAPLLAAEVAVAEASGPSEPDGAIVIEVTQGIAPIQYQWSTGDTTAIVSGLLPGLYYLTLSDAAGCPSLYIVEVGFVSAATGSGNNAETAAVYPNPVSKGVFVRPCAHREITIWSAEGKIVYRSALNGTSWIDLTKVPNGMYFCVLKGDKQSHFVRRLTVAH